MRLAPVLLIVLVVASPLAGCLQAIPDPLAHPTPEVWTTALQADLPVSASGSLLTGHVPGSSVSRLVHVAPAVDALRLTLVVAFSTPGNITVRLASPGGGGYQRSFTGAASDDFMRFDPSPGTWNLTVEGLGEGHVNATVDLHGPTS